MEKSVDAFRTISEVADDLQLPQHVLRFWETRFSQIRPLKRAGGRRYYRPADVVLLRSIQQLLYDKGYTIKGVQRLLKDKGLGGLRDEPDAEIDDFAELASVPSAEPPTQESSPTMLERDVESGGLAECHAGLVEVDCALLRETLSIITECENILDALRVPGR